MANQMEKVIDLLNSDREKILHSIKFFEKEIEHGKKAVEELQSPEFFEKHKDSGNWTESWTIEKYIKINVVSNNRAIAKYTEKLEEANDYLRQLESALTVLNETQAVEEHFYRLQNKYADAMKELEGRR